MIRAMTNDRVTPEILIADQWDDYALLDSGNLQKLERFGPYCFVRPEPQACGTAVDQPLAGDVSSPHGQVAVLT